jgi:hypothetical protein
MVRCRLCSETFRAVETRTKARPTAPSSDAYDEELFDVELFTAESPRRRSAVDSSTSDDWDAVVDWEIDDTPERPESLLRRPRTHEADRRTGRNASRDRFPYRILRRMWSVYVAIGMILVFTFPGYMLRHTLRALLNYNKRVQQAEAKAASNKSPEQKLLNAVRSQTRKNAGQPKFGNDFSDSRIEPYRPPNSVRPNFPKAEPPRTPNLPEID